MLIGDRLHFQLISEILRIYLHLQYSFQLGPLPESQKEKPSLFIIFYPPRVTLELHSSQRLPRT